MVSAPKRAVWVLAVAAFALQLAFVAESRRDRVFQVPLVDAAAYHQQAMALAADQPVQPRAFWQPPLYPYLLSAVYRLGMTDLGRARAFHSLLGVAAALLTYAVARRCVSPGGALAAGLGVCLYGPLLFYFTQLLPAGLAVVLNLLGLLLLLRLAERPTWPRALALGTVMGLTTIAVPTGAVMLVVALGWIVFGRPAQEQGPRRARGLLAAVALAGMAIAILPVTIRNYLVSGEVVPVSTNGGINLYIGNNPQTARTLTIRPELDWGRLVALPYRAGATTDVEADRFFREKVATYARQSPGRFVRGLRDKLAQALGSREIPRNLDVYEMARHSRILGTLVWHIGPFGFPFGLVGPLAALGAGVLMRRLPGRVLLGFAACYLAAVVAVFPASRYLAPVMPVFVVSAVAGALSFLEWPALPWRRRAARLGLIALAGLGINWPRVLPTDAVNYAAELHTWAGVGLQARGRVDEAVEAYGEALRLKPDSADAHRYLGTALRLQGRKLEAMHAFERAVALRPDHDPALHDLAIARYEQGRVDEAVNLLRRVLVLDPGNRQAMANLAAGLFRLNRGTEAADWLRKSKGER